MADAVALMRAASNTTKLANNLRDMWEARTKTKATLNEGTALDLVIRAQVDEVFLVLAHLGEAVLSLGIFNKDYYMQTLGEVQASIASCGHEFLPMAWEELDAELQYVCTAGFAICACFAPLPVYRGFGACVLGDWDWACPDITYLEEKAKKKAIRTVYGFKQKVDPQPARSAFLAFDHAIQILQVKSMPFLEKRPLISSFAEHQARYGPKPKKEVKDDIDWLEEWAKQLEKRGHPTPRGIKLAGWGIPFATWTSPYSCHVLKSHKDMETIVSNQMDPGRLLHAFVCRGNVNLDPGQLLLLPPRSPAESLLCWLEGLPATSHKIIRWEDLDTEYFEKKISKSLRKKIGQYPLPTQFAIRDPEASNRPSLPRSPSSPAVLEHPNTVSPPPYSPALAELHNQHTQHTQAAAELGSPDPRELAASPVSSPPPQASSPRSPAQHSASLPVPGTRTSSGLKSIHTLRRNTAGAMPAAGSIVPIAPTSGSPTAASPSGGRAQFTPPDVVELHEETVSPTMITKSTVPDVSAAVELPTDFQRDAPKPLKRKPVEKTKVPEAQSDITANEVPDTTGQRENMEMTAEPDEIGTTETATELEKTKIDEEKQKQSSCTATDGGSSNQYLELLNKVAKGEISPQVLGEMLQKGSFDQESSLADKATAATESQASEIANKSSGSTQSPATNIPYPLSVTERKNHEWQEQAKSATSPPYPETPTVKSSDSDQPVNPNEVDIPSSLKPGGH